MDNCLGIISIDNMENNFASLCRNRPIYMLPFGGRYRLIDFTISNMVNHGIRTVAVYTGEKIRSTMDHLGNGKPWELNRRFNGLFLFPPVKDEDSSSNLGDISQFHSTEQFFDLSREEYVFINNPQFIAKVNLDKAFDHFIESGADVTLIYKRENDPSGEMINCDKIHMDSDGKVKNIGINLATEKEFNHFIGMGFMKKSLFMDIVKRTIEQGNAYYFKDAMLRYNKEIKINTFEHKGHVETIRDLKSFYDANLNLLDGDISQELFFERGYVYTKSKDEPSTLYKETSNVQNSLIANGCIIEGQVENSIIFRGVKIGKGAIIKNSILMQKTEVEENAIVVNTITDKQAIIGEGVRIAGSSVTPYVVEKFQEIRKDWQR